MKIVEQVRPICQTEGCTKKASLSGKGDGKYRKYCWTCERKKYNLPSTGGARRIRTKKILRKSNCVICGWGKATCDVHRVKAGGKYTPENTLTLCPNCHRMAHEGKLTLI